MMKSGMLEVIGYNLTLVMWTVGTAKVFPYPVWLLSAVVGCVGITVAYAIVLFRRSR